MLMLMFLLIYLSSYKKAVTRYDDKWGFELFSKSLI